MRTSLLLLLLLSAPLANAQSPFQKLYYDQDTLYWNSHFIIETTNGDIVEVGRLAELNPDSNFLVFRRFDANGTLLNAIRIIPATAVGMEVTCGLELTDGTLLLFGADAPQACVIHLESWGGLISALHRVGNSGYYRSAFWENDSTIMAVGGAMEQGLHQLLVSRFNSSGTYLGSLAYTIDGHGADGAAGIRCAAGGVLIAAYGNDTIGSGSLSNAARTGLLRLDDDGEVLWAKRYVRPNHTFYPAGLVENADGSVLVGGATWTFNEQTHCQLMHVDALGDTLSTRVLHDVQDPANGFPMVGFLANTDSSVMFGGYMDQGSFLLTCDRTGSPLTTARFTDAHTITTPVASMYGDLLVPIAGVTPNGPYTGVALGVWRSAEPFALACSVPITMASSTPEILMGQGYTVAPVNILWSDLVGQCSTGPSVMTAFDPCLGTDVEPTPGPVAAISIWPVPAADRISVSATDMQRIDILDASGRMVLSMAAQGAPTMVVDIARLAAGPYQVRIATGTGVHVRHIVKE